MSWRGILRVIGSRYARKWSSKWNGYGIGEVSALAIARMIDSLHIMGFRSGGFTKMKSRLPMVVTSAKSETKIVSSLMQVKRIDEDPALRPCEVERTPVTPTTPHTLCMRDTKTFLHLKISDSLSNYISHERNGFI